VVEARHATNFHWSEGTIADIGDHISVDHYKQPVVAQLILVAVGSRPLDDTSKTALLKTCCGEGSKYNRLIVTVKLTRGTYRIRTFEQSFSLLAKLNFLSRAVDAN
jgi:hypothetical protein